MLGTAAAVVLAPSEEGSIEHPPDVVVALSGQTERLVVAEEIAEATGATLLVSWVPGSHPERDERCADQGERLRCFVPRPVSTAGEARVVGELAAEHDWDRLVVVTSRYHVGRAAMLVGQCVDDPHVEMVSATERLTAGNLVTETLGVMAGLTVQRACGFVLF